MPDALHMQEADGSTAVKEAQIAFAAAKADYHAEVQQRFVLPSAQQQHMCQVVTSVFETAYQQLELDHKSLIDADKENSRVLNNRQALLILAAQHICAGSHSRAQRTEASTQMTL